MPMRKGTRDNFQIRVHLSGEIARRFNVIKDAWGFENNAEVVRMMITRTYQELQDSILLKHLRRGEGNEAD